MRIIVFYSFGVLRQIVVRLELVPDQAPSLIVASRAARQSFTWTYGARTSSRQHPFASMASRKLTGADLKAKS